MKAARYSRWDGTQEAFSLDPRDALDAVSDLLMEGLDLEQALAWMREQGFELGGLDMRVMGIEELVEELRQQRESLYGQHSLDGASDELAERLDRLLDQEQAAQQAQHGFESARMNDFLARRHPAQETPPPLSERIEAFRDWHFADDEAGHEFQALLEELERLRELEAFLERHGARFHGDQAADYETAQALREQIEALERMMQDLREGNLQSLSPEELAEWLSEDASRSLVLLRDLEQSLERGGFLRPGDTGPELTPRAIRRLGSQALADVYDALRKSRAGAHETTATGVGLPRPGETRPYEFGDSILDLDLARTLHNAALREAGDAPGTARRFPLRLAVEDFEVAEQDFTTQTTTVLLLDMSWSMSWAGRFPAAKRVALALDHLIRTRYPRDHFFVVGFYTRAVELSVKELPEATWNMGDPFTNLQEGLMVAQRLIAQHPSASPQILVITDGQPTAYFRNKELHVEWPMGPGGISPHAAESTLAEVRRVTRQGITINTFMLDDAPELVGFVERMTEINRGRALFSRPGQLASYVMVDYLGGRKANRR